MTYVPDPIRELMENMAKEEDVIRGEAQAELEKKRQNIHSEYAARLDGLVSNSSWLSVLWLWCAFVHVLGCLCVCELECILELCVCWLSYVSMCIYASVYNTKCVCVVLAGSRAGGGGEEAPVGRDCGHDAQAGGVA